VRIKKKKPNIDQENVKKDPDIRALGERRSLEGKKQNQTELRMEKGDKLTGRKQA